MLAVVGTAGHVDHGKSALLHALTGSHPSHLPQEFSRGMTIDLGFASLSTAEDDEIGMIDVPGHERFLRNMVSSLWGLDLVLFVVAADEGWAALTQEHLRVVNALGIEQIMVAINKCDLANEQQIQRIEEQVLQKFLDHTDTLPDIWRVSCKTGDGIDDLRKAIIKQVRQIPESKPLSTSPHLYIDRVFSINGIGTTVTGTLRGGGITLGDVLTLYPSGQSVKVKSLHSYHCAREHVEPHRRVALSFRQLKKHSVARGDCLTTHTAHVSSSLEWIVQLRPEFSEMKKQCVLEVAIGTTHTQARCYLLGDGTLARLLLSQALPAFWGQRMLLMSPGGSHLIGVGRLVWTQPLSREQRPRLLKTMMECAGDDAKQIHCNIDMAMNGYTQIDDELLQPPNCHPLESWWIAEHHYQYCLNELNNQLQHTDSALGIEDMAQRVHSPQSMIEGLIEQQCHAGLWQRHSNGITRFGAQSNALNAEQQALYHEINLAGRRCYDANQHKQPRLLQLLKTLMEKKWIIPMEDKLFLTVQEYQTLISEMIAHDSVGETFTIAQARDKTGLARKQLIPLLNRMERDGWVKRVGDLRMIHKQYSNTK